MSSIRNRIKEIRNDKKLTITAVADLFGEKRQRMQDIEGGKQKLPEEIIVKYIEYFNINANWLLTGQGDMYRSKITRLVPPVEETDVIGVTTPSAILSRMYVLLGVQSDEELSRALGQGLATIQHWRDQGVVPYEPCEQLAEDKQISLKWLLTGFGHINDTNATMDRRLYIMNQLMEALPAEDQQEILRTIKEKKRINELEQQVIALTASK